MQLMKDHQKLTPWLMYICCKPSVIFLEVRIEGVKKKKEKKRKDWSQHLAKYRKSENANEDCSGRST